VGDAWHRTPIYGRQTLGVTRKLKLIIMFICYNGYQILSAQKKSRSLTNGHDKHTHTYYRRPGVFVNSKIGLLIDFLRPTTGKDADYE